MNIFGTSFDYARRLENVRKKMDEQNLDCILVHYWPNQYYIGGMYQHAGWYPLDLNSRTGPRAPLILFRDRRKDPVFLCGRMIGVLKEGTWIKDVRQFVEEPPEKLVAEVLKEKGVETGNIGIEEEIVVLCTWRELQKALPKARFKDASGIFYQLRMIKEPEEIELVKQSTLIAEAAIKVAIETAKPGVLESEVQAAALKEMLDRGAISLVEIMFKTGDRVDLGRGYASNWNRIKENDFCYMDIGANYMGYGSDITRFWVVGKPPEKAKKYVRELREAYSKALGFMQPGVSMHEAQEFARGLSLKLGAIHGVGLGPFHDRPFGHEEDVVFENGMTLSISANLQEIPAGLPRIRFEDDGVITPHGIEIFNTLKTNLEI